MIFDKGKAGLFPLSYREKKNEAQLIGGSKVRLQECRQSGMFLCAKPSKDDCRERTGRSG